MTENTNMRVWDQVAKTDPSHTKKVTQRGGFTAISAHYQIMRATEVFGPIGEGWGYDNGDPMFVEGLVIVPVTLWHGTRDNRFGPLFGGADLKDSRGKVDSDAPKKASTDGLTKGLSQLGFNADVFLGKFDDNKYIAQMEREFNPPAQGDQKPQGKAAPLTGPIKTRAEIRTKCGELVRELRGCGDGDQLDIVLHDNKALIKQVSEECEFFWVGDGADFIGLKGEIAAAREACGDNDSVRGQTMMEAG